MNIRFFIAIRFLLAKRRAMLMSLSGIVFGVGLFVLTQAQTSGFEAFFIKTILGTDGAMRIQDRFQDTMSKFEIESATGEDSSTVAINRKWISGVRHPRDIKNALQNHYNVSGVSEILRGSVEIRTERNESLVDLYGINIDEQIAVSNIENQIKVGSMDDFREQPKGILVGSVIARRNNITVGDDLIISKGLYNERYRISAIFETGVDHVDRKRIYTHMAEARAILAEPFGVSYLQVALFNADRAPEEALQFEDILRHSVTPWQKREKVWLDVFTALKLSSAITVSTIIIISGLGMFNTLVMIVMEKAKEIAILRSMGYTPSDISRIFLWQGAIVYAIGGVLGCLFGALATWGITKIPLRIRGVFATDSFVVHWSIWHYVAALLAAGVVVMIASYIPARRAARLEPGDIIRGMST